MSYFANQRVLVTGGSSGIGLALARDLAAAGAHVCIAARDEARLEEARAEIQAIARHGAKVHAVAMDVTNNASVTAGARHALDVLGGLDILINNAGMALPGYIESQHDETCRAMLEVNYLGAVRVIQTLLPHFVAQRAGTIVNVTSMLGFMGVFGYAAYAGSKYALAGYTDCLRQDLLPFGVRVCLCYPPTTDTPGLVAENRIKPPESWAIEGSSTKYPPAAVARAILRGIRRGHYTILVGAGSSFIWRAHRWFPGLVRALLDRTLRGHLQRHGDGRSIGGSTQPAEQVGSAIDDPRRDV